MYGEGVAVSSARLSRSRLTHALTAPTYSIGLRYRAAHAHQTVQAEPAYGSRDAQRTYLCAKYICVFNK